MRSGRRTMLLLGTVMALLAFIVLYMVLSRNPESSSAKIAPTPVPKQQVVVAAKDIKGFSIVTPDMVSLKELDPQQVLTPTTQITGQVVGKMLTRDYKADSQVNLLDVSDPGISQVLKKGERAFVLPIKEVDNFGGQLVDGDVVDVLWTKNFEVTTSLVGPDGKPSQIVKTLPTTKKILDNIAVLRVMLLRAGNAKKSGDQAVNAAPAPNSNDQAASQAAQTAAQQALYASGAETPFAAALILAVNDQQAEVLKFARESGVLNLTLRAKDDAEIQRTTGITDKIMNADYGVVVPELIIK